MAAVSADSRRPLGISAELNLLLAIALSLVQLAFLLFPKAWTGYGWVTALAIVLFAVSTYTFWALIHESIHGLLHPNRAINRFLGRILAVIHGCPLVVVRIAHLLHHRYNRIEDFAETYDPRTTSWRSAAVRHYLILLLGRYLSEVLVNVIVWLPTSLQARVIPALVSGPNYGAQLATSLANPRNQSEARFDAFAALALFAGSAWMFQEDWLTFATVHLVRGFVISLLDDAYHYGTPINSADNPDPAKNLVLGASWMVLNFNYHAVHHANPSVPWRRLPTVAKEQAAVFDEHYLVAALRQFAGPIPKDQLPRHSSAP